MYKFLHQVNTVNVRHVRVHQDSFKCPISLDILNCGISGSILNARSVSVRNTTGRELEILDAQAVAISESEFNSLIVFSNTTSTIVNSDVDLIGKLVSNRTTIKNSTIGYIDENSIHVHSLLIKDSHINHIKKNSIKITGNLMIYNCSINYIDKYAILTFDNSKTYMENVTIVNSDDCDFFISSSRSFVEMKNVTCNNNKILTMPSNEKEMLILKPNYTYETRNNFRPPSLLASQSKNNSDYLRSYERNYTAELIEIAAEYHLTQKNELFSIILDRLSRPLPDWSWMSKRNQQLRKDKRKLLEVLAEKREAAALMTQHQLSGVSSGILGLCFVAIVSMLAFIVM